MAGSTSPSVFNANLQHHSGPRRSKPTTAQEKSLPVYGAGCWVNGIPNGSKPHRTLLGPPPPNVAPWSWLPTARANRAPLLQAQKPSFTSHQPRGNKIFSSTGSPKALSSKSAPPSGTVGPKKHFWTNKGVKLGGEATLVGDQCLRDQRVAALISACARDQPVRTSSVTPGSTSQSATAPTRSLSAVPNIPVRNRFDAISEQGNY